MGALKGKDIAVVGGGVSGMTLFKALRKLGLHRTRIYEKADRLLGHYNSTEARLVHPNYNRWPMLDEPLSFTKLPVLNWYAGNAANVLLRIKEQFELRTGGNDPYDGVQFGHSCIEIVNSIDTGVSELRFEGGVRPVKADIVVIATGFGNDKKAELGFSGYWDKDIYQQFDPGRKHLRPSEIFGTGDGALIDALQCCAITPKDAHTIPLGVIGRLREDEAIVLPGPKGAPLKTNIYSELEKEIRDHELDSRRWFGGWWSTDGTRGANQV